MIIRTAPWESPILKAFRRRVAASDRDRPKGLHLSQITDDLRRAESVKPLTAAQFLGVVEVGSMLEDVIAGALRLRGGWEKPEPRTLDGIICSPDGYTARTATIDEIKTTRVSAREIEENSAGYVSGLEEHPKLAHYLWRLKGYMHVFGARVGQLHLLYLMGDYRPPFPIAKTYLCTPESKDELIVQWHMLVGHAQDRGWLTHEEDSTT